MTDLKIIKKLEKDIGKKLESIKLEEVFHSNNGYVLDKKKQVIGLNVSALKLSKIPGRVLDLKHLTHLSLSRTLLSDISALKDLKHLTHLSLGRTQLSGISALKELKNLTNLDLNTTLLSDISALKELTNLTTLDLNATEISDISALKDLKNLTTLNLNATLLSDISNLKDLKNLTTLNLNTTQLSDIYTIKGLTNLERLDLRNNKISHLPREIVALNMEIKWENFHTFGLNLYGNPLESPPVEIVKKGKEAILKYFEELDKAKYKPLNEVKLLLVGDGGAGKTSLVKRILGKVFDKNEAQTEGIDIGSWKIKKENETIKVHIWDFGGQEIMHATHQFFLSKRSLYILVLDGRKDEKTEYWLKLIESVGGDSPVLLVINKIDQNPGFEVNQKTLKRKYKSIKGFYRISCATGKGLKNFILALKEALSQLEMLRTNWPEGWFNIKTSLENMKEDFITYDRYTEICAEGKITDQSSQDMLVDFLNDLGIILHFRDLHLQDTHVLNPEWVTEGVYKIINSEKLAVNKGILKVRMLDGILKKREGDRFDYSQGKYRYIIELMKKFELCYAIDSQNILIPDLLQVEESEFYFYYAGSLKFVIEYDFLPHSIMPRFIVRMHNDIKKNLRWRTGVVLENRKFHASAVVTVDNEEKKLFIYVDGEQKRDYFSVIRHTIQDINHSFEKLEVTELVPLPDNDDITLLYDELLGYELGGKSEIYVGRLRKSYSVSELLDGIEKLRERKQRELPIIQEKIVPVVIHQPPEEKKKWYKTTWKVLVAIVAGIIALLTGIYTYIQIVESKTYKGLVNRPKTEKEIKQEIKTDLSKKDIKKKLNKSP